MYRVDPNLEKVVTALIKSDQNPIDLSIDAICTVFNINELEAIHAVYLADIAKQQQQKLIKVKG